MRRPDLKMHGLAFLVDQQLGREQLEQLGLVDVTEPFHIQHERIVTVAAEQVVRVLLEPILDVSGELGHEQVGIRRVIPVDEVVEVVQFDQQERAVDVLFLPRAEETVLVIEFGGEVEADEPVDFALTLDALGLIFEDEVIRERLAALERDDLDVQEADVLTFQVQDELRARPVLRHPGERLAQQAASRVGEQLVDLIQVAFPKELAEHIVSFDEVVRVIDQGDGESRLGEERRPALVIPEQVVRLCLERVHRRVDTDGDLAEFVLDAAEVMVRRERFRDRFRARVDGEGTGLQVCQVVGIHLACVTEGEQKTRRQQHRDEKGGDGERTVTVTLSHERVICRRPYGLKGGV